MDSVKLMDKVYAGHSLTQEESHAFFSSVMQGQMGEISLTAMLIALKIKGESPEEIAGAASAMVSNAKNFPRPDYAFADIVGTGGDGHNTINVSSAAAIVAATCGVAVAKHGNRSVSSKSGSADLFREFGVNLMMQPKTARNCLDKTGLCFLFAPNYHEGVKYAMPVRTELKTRTLFNLLGPLANPARPSHIMVGVYDKNLIPPYAQTLQKMGYEEAMVVHGSGLDEIALHDTTYVARVKGNNIDYFELTPSDLGVSQYPINAIEGGEPEENRQLIQELLSGSGREAHELAVAINAGALLTLTGACQNYRQGTEIALAKIRSGDCINTISQCAQLSQDES